MYKIYFIYLIDDLNKSKLPRDVLNCIPDVSSVEGNHTIRLYAIAENKKQLQKFKEQRYKDLFLFYKREYETKSEMEDVLGELSLFVLREHSYIYESYKSSIKTLYILSTDFEHDYCQYNTVDIIYEKLSDLPALFTFKIDILKDKYIDALSRVKFDDMLLSVIDPEASLPWEVFDTNELGAFVTIFGFTMEKDLVKEEGE